MEENPPLNIVGQRRIGEFLEKSQHEFKKHDLDFESQAAYHIDRK
jgi:hypothetical protein